MSSIPLSAARRKPATERRTEIVETASAVAVTEGLEKVTARRVADALGVYPGLVNHYFPSVDDLVATAFGHAATAERDEVYDHAEAAREPVEMVRRLLSAWLDQDRDAVSLLWLDAWQASRRRPALLTEVVRQMNADLARLEPLLRGGIDSGAFAIDQPGDTAMRIMSLVDALSVQAAIRSRIDYSAVRQMVISAIERELSLPAGALRLGS